MNFAFTEEQEQLREFVNQFMESYSPESKVRELMETDLGYDSETWSMMAEQLGLQSLIIPEEYGGQGFGYVELIVVLEEMGRALLCSPFFSTVVLAANTLIHSGDDDAKAELLPGIASGETIATLAFTEESGKWGSDGITMLATASSDAWELNGTKMYVLDGNAASLVIVAACTDKGISLFKVDGDADGLSRTQLATMDMTRKQSRLDFENVKATLIGEEGEGWSTLEKVLDLAAVALAAEQVGGAQQCLDTAVQYAKDRVQFGRPIGSFQAIKHKLADMYISLTIAKSNCYYAAWALSTNSSDLPAASATARVSATKAYQFCSKENIQTHGGNGFTWEYDCHMFYRRSKLLSLNIGSLSNWKEKLVVGLEQSNIN